MTEDLTDLIKKKNAKIQYLQQACGKAHTETVLAKHEVEELKKQLAELQEKYRELLIRNNKNAGH